MAEIIDIISQNTQSTVVAEYGTRRAQGASQAVLGAEIEVPTIDGRVKYRIPAGTQSGTTFRLKGKGVPSPGGRGDQFVTVHVETPRNLSQTQIEALRRFEATLHPGNYDSGAPRAKAG